MGCCDWRCGCPASWLRRVRASTALERPARHGSRPGDRPEAGNAEPGSSKPIGGSAAVSAPQLVRISSSLADAVGQGLGAARGLFAEQQVGVAAWPPRAPGGRRRRSALDLASSGGLRPERSQPSRMAAPRARARWQRSGDEQRGAGSRARAVGGGGVAGEGGHGQEGALGVVHAGDRRAQHLVEDQLGAVVGVQARAEVGQPAGGRASSTRVAALLEHRRQRLPRPGRARPPARAPSCSAGPARPPSAAQPSISGSSRRTSAGMASNSRPSRRP